MLEANKSVDIFAYVNNFLKYKNVESVKIFGKHQVDPKISIMIPTYKRPELLREAIKSALNQEGYNDYEIVIVDNDADGEFTHQTLAMIESLATDKIVYYRNKQNIGMSGNWNRCIELAHGEWMTILSDDDLLLADYLNNFRTVINKYSNAHRIEAKCIKQEFKKKQQIMLSDRVRLFLEMLLNRYIFLKFNSCFQSTDMKRCLISRAFPQDVMYKKNLAINIGGYSVDGTTSADWQFYIKYDLQYAGLYKICKYLSIYRWSVNETLKRSTRLRLLKDFIVFTTALSAKLKLNYLDIIYIKIAKLNLYKDIYSFRKKRRLSQAIFLLSYSLFHVYR